MPGRSQGSKEYDLKAAFLYNFTSFVEWPPDAFADAAAPFTVGVLGSDPFGGALDEVFENELVRGRKLAIQRYHRVQEIKRCHILFISNSEAGRLDEILAFLRGMPVLTVSDSDRFAQRGGMIRFVTEGSKVRLRINVQAIKEARLTVSSKLLRLAEVIGKN